MSCDAKIFVGDEGTDFQRTIKECIDDVETVVDLTTATLLRISFKKPNGTFVPKTATIVNPPGTDGLIRYVFVAGDLDQEGCWQWQARVEFPSGKWTTTEGVFHVYPVLA